MSKNKLVLLGIVVLLGVGFTVWLFKASSNPLPGQKMADLGRNHVMPGTQVSYNSNPPTSGKHYADWVKAGIYKQSKEDGNLVHSLEHGYVVISYNCDFKTSLVPQAFAHGVEEGTPSAEGSPSADLSGGFASEECHQLVDKLISVFEKKEKKKLIVVPRPGLDSKIALTAWTYIDKFNDFDESRIEKFIDAYRDQGPEKTME